MLKIYLARHGQDEDNNKGILNGHRDTSLTNLGFQQAKDLAEKIKEFDIKIDKVYSSPLKRAFDTAKTITNFLGIDEPKIINDLIERDFGSMTGKKISEIETLCSPDILKTKTITYFLSPKGAENFSDLLKRANLVLDIIKKNHNSENILLVTHGDIGKMLYTAYYNLNYLDVLKDFHFGNSELLLLSPNLKPENAHIFNFKQYNH